MIKVVMSLLLVVISSIASASEIHIYGDSIFTTSWNQVGKEISRLSGEKIFDHAVYGAKSNEIKEQYLRHPPPAGSIVVFDGGGNDILANGASCRNNPNDYCRDVAERALSNIKEMLEMMRIAGVSKAIFLGSHYPASISFGYNKIIDYVYPKLQDICDFDSLCLLVDPRPVLNPSYLEWDGVHPTWNGANILASLLFEAMQEITDEI